jgi:DNA-binding response OmpR family regulator
MTVDQPTATVLYVEDEVLLQDLVETALREAGFDVTVTTTGAAALKALEDNVEAFRGLVTDINLGKGPDGWAIAKRARELRPDVPVVYVSGASDHEWTSKGVPHSVMIAKPFAAAQVVVAISSLLVRTDEQR